MKYVLPLLILCLASTNLHSEEWELWKTDYYGQFEGKLINVIGSTAYFEGKNKMYYNTHIGLLTEENQVKVKQFIEEMPQAQAWSESESPMAKALKGRLFKRVDEKDVKFEYGDIDEPEFYVLYFGAEWCGPCKSFLRAFVPWYNEFKRFHVDNFEVVFVSSDRSGREMKRYMDDFGMDWPGLKFGIEGRTRIIRDYLPRSYPGMVILDRDGNLLHSSHSGEEYIGAHSVMRDMQNLVYMTNPRNPVTLRKLFPRYLERHFEQNQGADSQARPFNVYVDDACRALPDITDYEIQFTINSKGLVMSPKVLTEFSDSTKQALENLAIEWQFFPALERGRPVETTVTMPIVLN